MDATALPRVMLAMGSSFLTFILGHYIPDGTVGNIADKFENSSSTSNTNEAGGRPKADLEASDLKVRKEDLTTPMSGGASTTKDESPSSTTKTLAWVQFESVLAGMFICIMFGTFVVSLVPAEEGPCQCRAGID